MGQFLVKIAVKKNPPVIGDFFQQALETPRLDFGPVLLFGGDRGTCCDEAVVAETDGRIAGMATIAPNGELGNGTPTIVGLYVLPDLRRLGHGRLLLEAAIRRCLERGFCAIRVDIVSSAAKRLVAALPVELRFHLEVNDQGFYPLG